jgi:hypothetical protein
MRVCFESIWVESSHPRGKRFNAVAERGLASLPGCGCRLLEPAVSLVPRSTAGYQL